MKRAFLKIAIVGGVLLLLGGITFVIAMTAVGWDFSVLNTDYEKKIATYSAEEVNEIVADLSTEDVYFLPSEDDEITVEYFVVKNKRGKVLREIVPTLSDGVLRCVEKKKKYNLTVIDYHSYKVVVKAPADKVFALSVKLSTGNVTLGEEGKERRLSSLKVSASTGDVNLKGKTICEGDLTLSVSTGDIRFKGETRCDGKVSVKASTSMISVNAPLSAKEIKINASTGDVSCAAPLSFDSLDVSVSTGDVSLLLAGKKELYTYLYRVDTGSSNVESFALGSKKVNVRTTTGDIRVRFEE